MRFKLYEKNIMFNYKLIVLKSLENWEKLEAFLFAL